MIVQKSTRSRWILIAILVILGPLGVFYLFVVPAWVANGTAPINVGSVLFGGFLYCQFWMLAATYAYESAASLYGFPRRELFPFVRTMFRVIDRRQRASGLEVATSCAISYLLTLYGFAIAYAFLSRLKPHSFNVGTLSLLDSFYFSTVTAATVGYGDIVPSSGTSRLLVVGEILVSLVYAVFFFSVLAGAIRDGHRARDA